MERQLSSLGGGDLQATQDERLVVVPRLVAGLPLLAVGLAHVLDGSAPMRPLVEAAGLPLAAVLSPATVTAEVLAGILLLLGFYARVGSILAIPTMAVAIYAHLAIDIWPNGADNEPPIVLPLVVLASAGYVLWRGGGAWSLDRFLTREGHL